MGLVDKIKAEAKKSGTSKSKFIYFREGEKVRIRFLQDMDDGMEVVFHDSFERGVNVPCQEHFHRSCIYCEDETLRTRSQYVWSVWNYEANEVQLFMFAVNNCSPIPALMAMYENYGTLCDRDYVVTVNGKQTSRSYSVVPMDKVKMRNEKAKPYSDSQVLKMIDKAFPSDAIGTHEDEDESEVSESKYDGMTAKELYKLCKEKGIEVKPKKPEKFYINQLEEYDEAYNDWDDDYDDDDWEEDDE